MYASGGPNRCISLEVIFGSLETSLKGRISSNTHAALPKVPITKSCSRGCITRSLAGAVGKIFESNFSHFSPAFKER